MNRFVPYSANPTMNKSVGSTLNYSWDWSEWLAGDTISAYAVTGKGINVLQWSIVGSVVTAMVSGGKLGRDASVKCEIVTSAAPQKIESRTLHLVIVPR